MGDVAGVAVSLKLVVQKEQKRRLSFDFVTVTEKETALLRNTELAI